MDIRETKEGHVAIVELIGSVDTRSSFDFEKKVLELLQDESRFFVVDFAEVSQLTSSGIRVLLMLGQKLARLEGALVLCQLSDHVQTVIEISGLGGHLAIFPRREEALAHLSSVGESFKGRVSKVSSLASRLLGSRGDGDLLQERPPDFASGSSSLLSQEVARLLTEDLGREPDEPSEHSPGDSRDA